MSLKEALIAISELERDGIVERYAIGGAIAAAFYLQPTATLDVDVFVALKPEPGELIISLRPIYDYWSKRGATIEKEHVVISGWPVQFLSLASPLGLESMSEAVIHDVDGRPIRTFTPEHLAAIALDTGRAKDFLRLIQFVESGVLNDALFHAIVARHDLTRKWKDFQQKYLSG